MHETCDFNEKGRVFAIEESKDIDKIPLTELVGNLQTYELGNRVKARAWH